MTEKWPRKNPDSK